MNEVQDLFNLGDDEETLFAGEPVEETESSAKLKQTAKDIADLQDSGNTEEAKRLTEKIREAWQAGIISRSAYEKTQQRIEKRVEENVEKRKKKFEEKKKRGGT